MLKGEEEYGTKDLIAVGLVNATLTALQLAGATFGDSPADERKRRLAEEYVIKMWNLLRKNPLPE